MIATGTDAHAETLFYLSQMLVELSTEYCQVADVVGFQNQIVVAGVIFAVQIRLGPQAAWLMFKG